jgi:hypothetical protein
MNPKKPAAKAWLTLAAVQMATAKVRPDRAPILSIRAPQRGLPII